MQSGGTRAESKSSTKKMISESKLMEDSTYREFRAVGRMIVERKMSEKEILDLFAMIEKGATAGGNNRTMIGKGKDAVVDVATAISKAYNGVADKISKSGPVSGADVLFDKLTDRIAGAAGGQEGAVMTAIKKYRNFAKAHPIMQGAIYAILIALTGLSGAGLGGAAILGGIKMADKLLLGNKLSSSLWSGFVTGATAYGVGQAKDAFSTAGGGSAGPAGTEPDYVPGGSAGPAGTEPDYVPGGSAGPVGTEPDFAGSGPPMHTVQSGDTLSQIAQTNNTSVEELMKLNPKITNPDVITAGQPIKLPVPGNTLPTYDNGVGTAANTEQGIQTGRYTPNPRMQTAGYVNNKNKLTNETIQFKAKKIPIKEMIDPQQTLYFRSLQESLGNPATKSYQLTYAGIDLIFENMVRYQKYLAEAPGATAPAASGPDRTNIPDELRPDMPGATGTPAKKGFLGRAWSGIKNAGHQFTTKLTAEKLKMNWHVAGKPTDSDQLKSFLEKQGAPTDVINDIYTQLGLQAAAAPAQPASGVAAQPASGVAAQPAASGVAAQPTASGVAAQPAQPAASGGAPAGNIFANPQKLAASFKEFTDSGATIPMQFRGVLGDILKTALRTVENKQRRMTAIISESRRIDKEMRKLKQR